MNKRIPLQIVEGRLVLTAVIECKSLRVRRQITKFVIDTGSSTSFLSEKDVKKLQIPIKGKKNKGEIDFGGSRFNYVSLPVFNIYLLEEDKKKDCITLKVNLSALQTTKTNPKKVQVAEMLPSILGLDFLKEQKLSLHVILTEDMAFLEVELWNI